MLERFQADTGIKVDYHTFSTAEELRTVLASGEAIDVAVPSHNDLTALIEAGRLHPLETLPAKQDDVRDAVWKRFHDGA